MAKKDIETKLEITTCDIKGIDRINIESLIRIVRGQQVMLDSDLAMLYGVETKRLNEQVKRNLNRFPEDFMFQLTQDEAVRLRSQIATLNDEGMLLRSQFATSNEKDNPLRPQFVTSNGRGGNRYLPYAFTRNGIAMLSSVLRSDTAVEVNIRIMRAFTMIPQLVNHNTQIIERIFNIEQHQQETDKTIKVILDRIEDVSPKLLPEQVFLTDLKKHNTQYPEIAFIQLPHRNHDRFLIIDDKVYLLGASLKDMGAGLCAVTEMSIAPEVILGMVG